MLRNTMFGPFSWLFRGFFVAAVLGKFYAYSPWNSLLIGFPRKQKIGVKNVGFKLMKLERNVDNFGREIWA